MTREEEAEMDQALSEREDDKGSHIRADEEGGEKELYCEVHKPMKSTAEAVVEMSESDEIDRIRERQRKLK